jgi:opacity protein-like surface antigen
MTSQKVRKSVVLRAQLAAKWKDTALKSCDVVNPSAASAPVSLHRGVLNMVRSSFLSALLASTAILLAPGYGAMAADIAPEPEPLADWTGFHIGIGGGYGTALHDGFTFIEGSYDDFDIDGDDQDFFLEDTFDDLGDEGGILTIEGGFDLQLGERFVAGIQGDFTWTNFDSNTDATMCYEVDLNGTDDSSLCANTALNVEIDHMWTIAGRFGFLSSPETLWYGLVGWTHADVDARHTITFANDPDPAEARVASGFVDDDENLDGLTFGGGVETLLSDAISLKLEYRYTDLNSLDFSDDFDLSSGEGNEHFRVFSEEEEEGAGYDFDTRIQTIRLVLSWRF